MGTELRVRPVAESDDLGGLSPVWGAPLALGGPPPAGAVVAVRDRAVIGLAVIAPAPPGLRIEQLHARAPAQAGEALAAVTTAQERVDLYARDAPDALHAVAETAGFELVFSQVRSGARCPG